MSDSLKQLEMIRSAREKEEAKKMDASSRKSTRQARVRADKGGERGLVSGSGGVSPGSANAEFFSKVNRSQLEVLFVHRTKMGRAALRPVMEKYSPEGVIRADASAPAEPADFKLGLDLFCNRLEEVCFRHGLFELNADGSEFDVTVSPADGKDASGNEFNALYAMAMKLAQIPEAKRKALATMLDIEL